MHELNQIAQLNAAQASRRYGRNTLGAERRIAGAFLPTDTAQVQAIVQWARASGNCLHPLSTGRNWGYGSATPSRDDVWVVDLSGMNQVIHYDAQLGTVTLQPGVTQQMLYDFFQQHNLPLMVPTTGAGPNVSIIGNALERGYGVTHQFDSFGNATALQAVLADGSLYQSPLLAMGGTEVAHCYKWGVGPYLDGMFAQGDYGIVVEMSFALKHQPESILGCFYPIADQACLLRLIEPLQDLCRRFGNHLGPLKLTNHHRLIRGPAGNNQLPADTPPWMGFGAIYGDAAITALIRQAFEAALAACQVQAQFIEAGPGAAPAPAPLQGFVDLLSGKPSSVALPFAYYRANRPCPPAPDLSIDQDGCGLIWFAPLIPMKTGAVADYLTIVEQYMAQYQLDRAITLTSLSERCFDSATAILFDANNPSEVSKAQRCYQALFEACQAKGMLPYRIPNGLHHGLLQESAANTLAQRIKQALDPNQIFCPR